MNRARVSLLLLICAALLVAAYFVPHSGQRPPCAAGSIEALFTHCGPRR